MSVLINVFGFGLILNTIYNSNYLQENSKLPRKIIYKKIYKKKEGGFILNANSQLRCNCTHTKHPKHAYI